MIQLLDKCLRGNKIAPLWHACLTSLCSALVLKACNFIAPLTLIQQFHIALFFHFLVYCGALGHFKTCDFFGKYLAGYFYKYNFIKIYENVLLTGCALNVLWFMNRYIFISIISLTNFLHIYNLIFWLLQEFYTSVLLESHELYQKYTKNLIR